MGRPPTLPTKSPKRLQSSKPRRRSGSNTSIAQPAAASASGVSANIRVAVRVRPENERERAGAFNNVIQIIDDKMMVFDPKDGGGDDFFFHGKKQGRRDLNKKENKDKKFAFDAVFPPGSSNKQVFENTTKDLVDTVFNGYNCSVFAYGATGAGKTFTMLGGKDCPGITFLTMEEIYKKIDTLEDKTCEVGISYLEVYNETIRDLLKPAGTLEVRETGNSTAIPGLTMHKPTGPENILSLLSFGNGHRTQHATDANKESSRSHAVLQVFIKLKDKDAGLSTEVKVAKMSLIDLAGSEKGAVTGNKGARFREGSNINKSLLALGNCINALADGAKYIPYRNSKLTRLLKDSIGGNCRTVMIANVSPSSETFEDTFNTLKYADRAKKIKINLKKNVLNVDFHVAQYVKIVEDLRGEISQLKERIEELEKENASLKSKSSEGEEVGEDMEVVEIPATDTEKEKSKELESLQKTLNRYIERQRDYDDLVRRVQEYEELNKEQESKPEQCDNAEGNVDRKEILEYKNKIKELESRLKDKIETPESEGQLERLVGERKKLISKILSEESSLVNLKMRINFKRKLDERNMKITIGQKEAEKSETKTSKAVETLSRKVERKEERLKSLKEEILKNQAELEAEMSRSSSQQACKLVRLEIEVLEARAQSRHLSSMISSMGHKLETQDCDLNDTLVVLRKNHVCLRGYDLASKADQKQYEDLRSQLMENRLKWCDTLEEFSDQEPEIQPVQFYSSVSQLSLPSLRVEELERPRSREENNHYDDTASTCVPEELTAVETTLTDQPSPTPPPCKSEKAPSLTVPSPSSFPALPPTPNLVLSEPKEELLPPTPRVFGNNSFEILPATPQTTQTVKPPLIRKQTDTSFVHTPELTPKRSSDADHQEQGAAKKLKLMSQINWEVHRESNEVPVTPQAVTGTRALNETFDSEPGSPQLACASSSLNETITLETNMVEKCDIQPANQSEENLNSTFAVEEPMDVDATNSVNSLRVFADMSVIKPSKSGHLEVEGGSPIRAGVTTPNTGSGQSKPRRSPRTSSMPPPGQPQSRRPWQSGKGSSGLTPQLGATKPAKKSLKHSVSASVLPRQGSSAQPLSSRTASRPPADNVKKPWQTKENPSEKKPFSNKFGSSFGKLKKSVSSANVLRQKNNSSNTKTC